MVRKAYVGLKEFTKKPRLDIQVQLEYSRSYCQVNMQSGKPLGEKNSPESMMGYMEIHSKANYFEGFKKIIKMVEDPNPKVRFNFEQGLVESMAFSEICSGVLEELQVYDSKMGEVKEKLITVPLRKIEAVVKATEASPMWDVAMILRQGMFCHYVLEKSAGNFLAMTKEVENWRKMISKGY